MSTSHPLSDALIDVWRSGQPLDATAATRLAPADDAGAYRVQREVAAALGWFADGRPRAWKMGASGRDTPPTAAPIPDAALLQSPASLQRGDRHVMVGVEVELAVRLAHPLAPGCSADEAAAAVGEVLAAIEICDMRARDWPNLPALYRLADQQMNRWLILGSGRTGPWRESNGQGEVLLQVDGRPVLRQRGGHPLDDPLYLLPWLAEHAAAEYPDGLRAGDVITTGTWTGLHEARAGERIHAVFDGIGEVTLTVA